MKNQTKGFLAIAAIAGACGVSVACGNTGTVRGDTSATEPPTIDVVRVVERPVGVNLDIPGELQPYEAVAIFPKVTGFVRTMRVDRGSHVRAGELLAQLEAPELAAGRAEAQSKLRSAEAQLEVARSKADADASTYDKLRTAATTPGVVAGNDLVLAQKAVEADRSQVAAAQQNVEAAREVVRSTSDLEGYLRVTAPFDGVVTERNVHPGALVGPNSGAAATAPIVRVMKTDRLRLVVPVPEAYVAGISEGTTVQFTVSAYPGEMMSGAVARVAHSIDTRTRTMAVELDVMNRDGRLAPGTFCQIRWPVRRPSPSLMVPSATVATTTDRVFVVRIRDGRTEWVNVTTGLTSGPLVEVFGELRAGDTVAARGTDELRPGTVVRTKENKPVASRLPISDASAAAARAQASRHARSGDMRSTRATGRTSLVYHEASL